MDYPFENLGAERFQKFCQALMLKEYPNVQCLPLYQADGGRDILSYLDHKTSPDFIMMQVKFTERPAAINKPSDWLAKIIRDEAPKVNAQIPKGAIKYIIITNVCGTAKPELGSIDKIDRVLGENISIPAMCLWRDDLNRRLDNAHDLKWIYPELMTGPDILRVLVEGNLGSDKRRRLTTINAFLANQYKKDKDVKFKQIDLINDLLDLFVDVPITADTSFFGNYVDIKNFASGSPLLGLKEDLKREKFRKGKLKLTRLEKNLLYSFSGLIKDQETTAVNFLLGIKTRLFLPKVVIEGAPGQGKSTIVQYLCQLHRIRLLNKDTDLRRIPAEYKGTPLRIPLKTYLKDLAIWLAGKNPFYPGENNRKPTQWTDSLASFLAALITYESGGAVFTVDDLYAVTESNPLLIVLDGLDEVADIDSRKKVVEVIENGVEQLEQIADSLQVVITSRPAAFANSPGLPGDRFVYMQLSDLSQELIRDYAEKWIKARELTREEGESVTIVLNNKINEPHIRELARNPMQLAILLNLIHKKGTSLPDKRTALYDSYIELFFDREAEKDAVVREHRGVLIQIHQYLAWILHSEAETKEESGRVSTERLKELLENYLKNKGYDVALTYILFKGMVERVVALVPRVEGTYEFEVQTLREYFAGCYLYETAPHSSPGYEKPVTKYERFTALAENPYWLNVTRFYAGRYGRGELPSLLDGFNELVKHDTSKLTNRIPELLVMLLSDWVFTQSPNDMRKALSFLFEKTRFRRLISTYSFGNYMLPKRVLSLPRSTGKEELVKHCFELLKNDTQSDIEQTLCKIITINIDISELKEYWMGKLETNIYDSDNLKRWVKRAYFMGLIRELKYEEILKFYRSDNDRKTLFYLILDNRFDFIESKKEFFDNSIELLLCGKVRTLPSKRFTSLLECFYSIINIRLLSSIFTIHEKFRLMTTLAALNNEFTLHDKETLNVIIGRKPRFGTENKCKEILSSLIEGLDNPVNYWVNSTEPWEMLIENIRNNWGDNWFCYELANLVSYFIKPDGNGDDFADLLDSSKSLIKRICYARSKSRAFTWWKKQFNNARDEEQIMYTILIALTSIRPNILMKLIPFIDEAVCNVSLNRWDVLINSVNWFFLKTDYDINRLKLKSLPNSIDARTVLLLSYGLNSEGKRFLCKKYLGDYAGSEGFIGAFFQEEVFNMMMRKEIEQELALDFLGKGYAKDNIISGYYFYDKIANTRYLNKRTIGPSPVIISEKTFKMVLENPELYPSVFVGFIEDIYRFLALKNVTPLGILANEEKWFEI